jgi:hypothetical protein
MAARPAIPYWTACLRPWRLAARPRPANPARSTIAGAPSSNTDGLTIVWEVTVSRHGEPFGVPLPRS